MKLHHLFFPWKNLFGYFWKLPLLSPPLEKSFRRPCL